MMKAAVTTKAGKPNVIQIQEKPIPAVQNGWVLIKIKAFGINRSEIFTRQGDSPNVKFPRVQGIECVGEVENDPSGTYKKGQKVAAIMGGMGRDFDGGYAEYAALPLAIVFPFESKLPWETLGAIPEMFQTVSGSLNEALEVKKGETLLIRGGTSSIGMLACQLAKHYGLTVIATTRNADKEALLKSNGADHVLVDDGDISSKLKSIYPQGVDNVLELIGITTLKDSLKCVRPRGVVCMTGILGGQWTMKEFTPMGDIPSLARLTVYMGDAANLSDTLLQDFINAVEAGEISLNISKVFKLDDIVKAHELMESNQAGGKIVVVS
ncbi:NADPH:quinone reductase [Mucilaginibacter mallensis]|uniref:NADPH:quinone reductase n=1 Tax=Mucilaginibacter mallensis TaxID=652787 RepID=A0A1H2CBM6_MUCMA|nr:zinc-binding alcohol dehydrogenase family protein [Mucilaginibacter mallensis]SDT67739.1 NADPH:quinone reductase [Mucilaginibacter mallensis]